MTNAKNHSETDTEGSSARAAEGERWEYEAVGKYGIKVTSPGANDCIVNVMDGPRIMRRHVRDAIIADHEAAQRVGELEMALRDLIDVQNGPPLPSYEKDWNAAMAKAEALLTEVKG